jgi:hypothetical protein
MTERSAEVDAAATGPEKQTARSCDATGRSLFSICFTWLQ